MYEDQVNKFLRTGRRWRLTAAEFLAAYAAGVRDFQGANLEWTNLEGANLNGVNLEGANLREANLEGANLNGVNLEGANLREANLEGANLRRANLRRANLEGANLRRANLRRANLEGANLEGATYNTPLRMSSRNDTTTICVRNNKISLIAGCWQGSVNDFITRIESNKHGAARLAYIADAARLVAMIPVNHPGVDNREALVALHEAMQRALDEM